MVKKKRSVLTKVQFFKAQASHLASTNLFFLPSPVDNFFVPIFSYFPIFNFCPNFQFSLFCPKFQFLVQIFNLVDFVPIFNFFPNHLLILSRAVDWNFQSYFLSVVCSNYRGKTPAWSSLVSIYICTVCLKIT